MHADKAVQELIRQSLQGDGDSEEDEDLEWELEAEVSEMEEDMYDGGQDLRLSQRFTHAMESSGFYMMASDI